MNDPPLPSNPSHNRSRKVAMKAANIGAREYLPMAATLAFWAVTALAVGHANAARLLAATVLFRAVQMLTELTTVGPLRLRKRAAVDVWRKSRRRAMLMQAASVGAALLAIGAIAAGLVEADQDQIAGCLLVLAIALFPRAYRAVEPRASSRYLRLIVAIAALVGAVAAWILGGGALSIAAAYAGREWVAALITRVWRLAPIDTKRALDQPLGFAEVARNTVVTSRRLLTYRLTKNLLTIFGPFGNFAARTGRGMGWHSKLEPYMPHRLSGFILFALLTGGGAVFLAVRSGEPAAMIAGAGLLQLCAIALNVLILWRYLPRRDDPNLVVEEDEDD